MRWRALYLAFGLLAGACAAPEDLKQAPASRFIQAAPVPAPADEEVAKAAVAPPPAEQHTPPEPERDYPEPAILKDLSADKVTSLLGTPGFKRLDDPAEIWQYQAETCVMDLYLYEMLDREGRSVAHFEMRSLPGMETTLKNCFISVIKAAETQVKRS